MRIFCVEEDMAGARSMIFPKRERIDLPKPMIRCAQKIIGGARSMILPERERIDLPSR